MDLNNYQVEFKRWHEHNFPDADRREAALAVAEEAGELCRAVLKQRQGIRGSEAEWEAEIVKEIGDIILAVTWMASLMGIYIEDAVARRWWDISQRDWVANRNGHGLPHD